MYYENEKMEDLKITGETFEDDEFFECEFKGCVFEDCTLYRCSFTGCSFTNCNIISIKSKYSQIKYSQFEKCNLIGVHWNELLPEGRIAEPIHTMSKCFLKYNSFEKMKLMKFDFSGNIVQESVFDNCDLKDSSFKGCRLEKTQYTGCDIRKADFREANGYQIDIMTNKLKGAKFSFPEVINLLNVLEIKVD